MVYEFLLLNKPVITFRNISNNIKWKNLLQYNYLENESIVEKLLAFNDGETSVVAFFIPSIHCSSCIWVLENLSKLNKGVTTSMVNFPKKLLRITFKNKNTNLIPHSTIDLN